MTTITRPSHPVKGAIHIPGSKSISNRVLVLSHLFKFDPPANLSDSDDTRYLQQALKQIKLGGGTIDIGHAGTDMRFLTALLAVSEGSFTLTGSSRMKERPIGELVNVLRDLGADIAYLEKENYPPLRITGKKLDGGAVSISGAVSSQFISSLLLVAHQFKNGLQLTIRDEIVSRPYISMTIALLKQCGIAIKEKDNTIEVPPQQGNKISISEKTESDWSAASYWYSICALSPASVIGLSDFNAESLQADAVLQKIFKRLGVVTTFNGGSVLLEQQDQASPEFEFDFTACPDIAQTLAVTCFGLGTRATLHGLKTLRIKETDRITALKKELEKLGATVKVTGDSMQISGKPSLKRKIIIDTYNDHRMALSFAPLSLVYGEITIRDFKVVNKSYPTFPLDLLSLGFNVNLQPS